VNQPKKPVKKKAAKPDYDKKIKVNASFEQLVNMATTVKKRAKK
jgi:hypothetical protein